MRTVTTELGEIGTYTGTTIGTGTETGTRRPQITPHSNAQTNRSTAGRTAYAITSRARVTGRRRATRPI